jgi:anti-sigma factor RsiW
MDCCEFREKYSDYTDGLLTDGEAVEAGLHMAACAACRRFDAAFRAGVDALRSLPAVGTSPGFGSRLRARIRREVTVRLPVVAHWSGALGTLLLVAAVGVVGWDLANSRTGRHDTLPIGRTALAMPNAPLAAPAQAPVTLSPRDDSAIYPAVAFHPLQSVLVESTWAATAAPVPTSAGDRPRFDLSVVWGGR